MSTDKKVPPALGQLLTSLRKKHRYSMAGLARATGVSAGYIGMLEQGYDKRTGKPVKPHPEILMALGAALGDSYAALTQAAGYLPEELARLMATETEGPERIHGLPQRRRGDTIIPDQLRLVLVQLCLPEHWIDEIGRLVCLVSSDAEELRSRADDSA